jgi:ribosomal 30S subunit maturation factor RimM
LTLSTSKKWLRLGRVGRAHGVRGSFFISDRVDKIPDTIEHIFVGDDPDKVPPIKILGRFMTGSRPAITCEGISDRNTAEAMTGQLVWVESERIKVDDRSEYLLSDITGRSVHDGRGNLVGVVESCYMTNYDGVNVLIYNQDKHADIDIPFSSTYFDMSFKRGGHQVTLIVEIDFFEEIWNPREKK